MPSKQVADREKSGLMVVSSGKKYDALLARKIAEYLGVEPETTSTFLRAAMIKLETSLNATVAADHAHLVELNDDAPEREERDQAADALLEVLVSLRETVTATYGEGAARQLGFAGRNPIDQVLLRLHGDLIAKQLASWTPPAQPLIEGAVFRQDQWTQKLNAPLLRLTTALAAVAREKREAEETLVAKNRAIEESDRAFAFTATVLSAMLEAVGEPEFARRVRPSRRRPGQTNEEAAVETETQADSPSTTAKG